MSNYQVRKEGYYDSRDGKWKYHIERYRKGKWRWCFGGLTSIEADEYIKYPYKVEEKITQLRISVMVVFSMVVFGLIYFSFK